MDFTALNKQAEKSFYQQKSLIKKVLAGQKVKCPTCTGTLVVKATETGFSLCCPQQCTDIALDAQIQR